MWYKILAAAIGGWRDQAFLDRRWFQPTLLWLPRLLRRRIALELLAHSPHYFIYQFTSIYPPSLPRREVLELENRRLTESRNALVRCLVASRVDKSKVVLDFGCGPGYLAHAISPLARQVIACDISRGVLACASMLNGANNLSYLISRSDDPLASVQTGTADLVTCFAVFQHLTRQQTATVLHELARCMRVGGWGILHFAVGEPIVTTTPTTLRSRYQLRFDYYSLPEAEALIREAGFTIETFRPTRELCAGTPDDIGLQHIALVRR